MTEVLSPTCQTLGESLEIILGEVFDDYLQKKPYQMTLDSLIRSDRDKEEVLKRVGDQIGDEGLSYVLGAFADSDDIELEEPDEIS